MFGGGPGHGGYFFFGGGGGLSFDSGVVGVGIFFQFKLRGLVFPEALDGRKR